MLSGLSFSSAFVFSINSLIFSGFPLTSCHLAEASIVPRAILKKIKNLFFCVGVKVELKPHYLLFRGFISLCVQLSKNITKCFLFIIIHIFSMHFGINLFYFHILNNVNNVNSLVDVICVTPQKCFFLSKPTDLLLLKFEKKLSK